MRITVLKSSGKKQSFQARKIAHTVKAAGAGAALAKLVAECVAKDLQDDLEHFSQQLVPTALIKNKVIRYLKLSSPRTARAYTRYKKKN
jgi:transcriptional regulator NrdR family protein